MGSTFLNDFPNRKNIIQKTIEHFISLNTGGDPIFGNHIDFSRTGLLGHGRGAGEPMILMGGKNLPPDLKGKVNVKGIIAVAPTAELAHLLALSGFAFMTILPAGDGIVIHNDGARYYDRAVPDPFKCQLYIHHANHNFFNTEWVNGDQHGLAVMSKDEHKKILLVFGSAFYRAVLLGEDTQKKFLAGETIFSGIKNEHIHISFERMGQLTVDDYEHDDIKVNTLGQAVTLSGSVKARIFPFNWKDSNAYNISFFGNTKGMVVWPAVTRGTGQIREQLTKAEDLTNKEVWIRAAEVYKGCIPAGATGFQLGLEDTGGKVVWVDSDQVGGLPRPYDRRCDDAETFWMNWDRT